MPQYYPQTIKRLNEEIEALQKEVKRLYEKGNEAYYSSDGWHSTGFRALEMDRLTKQRTLHELEQARNTAKPLAKPRSPEMAKPGTEVAVKLSIGETLSLHICSPIDARMLGNTENKSGSRMLSTESALGKKILGKKVGDTVRLGDRTYTITDITPSSLL